MLIEEKEEALKKRCQESRKYVSSEKMDTNVNDITKLASDIQARKICQEICTTIISLQRILLQLEQHNLRIKLGKYVIKYSEDIDQVIAAYVDFLGWTNILLGDVKKGLDYVRVGMEYIDY